MRNALIKIVRDEVEDIFFKIGAGAADAVNLVLADHLRKRKTKLGSAHGARDGDKHLAARGEMIDVTLGRVHQRRGIEMTIVMLDKRGNGQTCCFLTPIILNYHIGSSHAE